MIVGTHTKQPYEAYNLEIDYVDALASGETINASPPISAVDQDGNDCSFGQSDAVLSSATGTVSSTKILVPVTGGTDGNKYTITVKSVTSDSNKYEDEIIMEVTEIDQDT